MSNIDVLAARRPAEALAEITRRSRRLRTRRRVLGAAASLTMAVVLAAGVGLTGAGQSTVRVDGVADEGVGEARQPGTGQGSESSQSSQPAVGAGSPRAGAGRSEPGSAELPAAPVPNPAGGVGPPPAPAWIALTDYRQGEVVVMRTDGTQRRRVSTKAVNDGDSAAWSPDGRHVAYTFEGTPSGPVGISVVGLDGGDERTVVEWPAKSMITDLHWGDDGRLWYLRRNPDLTADLWSVPADDGAPERRVLSGIRSFDLAPGGLRIAAVLESGRLVIAHDDGAVEQDLGSARTVAWSGDGRRLAVGDGQGVFVVNLDGTGRRQVTSPPSGTFDDRLSWRGGGDVLAVERRPKNPSTCSGDACVATVPAADIFLVDAGAGREARVVAGGMFPALAPTRH
jgi:hypothetical protein